MQKYLPEAFKKIVVIAPAGTLPAERVIAGISCLEKLGVEVILPPHFCCGGATPYLSAPLTQRLNDLHWAFTQSGADAVWALRGGCGSAQLLPHIDYRKLRKNPLPLIGFSDICALQLGLLRQRAIKCAISSPMAGKLPEVMRLPELERRQCADSAFAALNYDYNSTRHEQEILPLPTQSPLKNLNTGQHPGNFSGRALALNLTILTTLCGTPYIPKFADRVIILEDLNEPIYKLDRMLHQLSQNKIFRGCQGVIFGQFSNCSGSEAEKIVMENIFTEFLQRENLPGLMNYPLGHDLPTLSINSNQLLRVDADRVFID
ncbi:MAG: LD-carboxypeptidase [Victivallaceae bacterium]